MVAATEESARCPEAAQQCSANLSISCLHGGKCCHIRDTAERMFCACPTGYEGDRCEARSQILDALESRANTMRIIGLSSGISIAVGVIALIALGTITFLIVRSTRKRRRWALKHIDNDRDLDRTIVYVQEEVAKLPTIQQLCKLQRLSKLFEKTAREAILSDSGNQMPRPASTAMNESLPRWSSAPSCVNRPSADAVDQMDSPDGADDVFQKTKLLQVFSLQ